MPPKREFSKFIKHIKNNPGKYERLNTPEFFKHIKLLSQKLNNPNKTLQDYNSLKLHHMPLSKIILTEKYVTHNCIPDYGDDLEKLWLAYIQNIIEFIINYIMPF